MAADCRAICAIALADSNAKTPSFELFLTCCDRAIFDLEQLRISGLKGSSEFLEFWKCDFSPIESNPLFRRIRIDLARSSFDSLKESGGEWLSASSKCIQSYKLATAYSPFCSLEREHAVEFGTQAIRSLERAKLTTPSICGRLPRDRAFVPLHADPKFIQLCRDCSGQLPIRFELAPPPREAKPR